MRKSSSGVTQDPKEIVERLLRDTAKQFRDNFIKLSKEKPEKFVSLYIAFLEFVVPKVSRVDQSEDKTPSFKINFLEKLVGEIGEGIEESKSK